MEWYKRIIGLRNGMDVLKTGEFIPVYCENDVYGFVRRIQGGRNVFGHQCKDGFALVLVNRSRYKAYTVKLNMIKWGVGRLTDILNNCAEFYAEDGYLTVEILPLKGRLITG